VFAGKKANSNGSKENGWLAGVANSIIVGVLLIIVTVVTLGLDEGTLTPQPLVVAALGLTAVQWIISASTRHAILRFILCPKGKSVEQRETNSSKAVIIISKVLQALIIVCLQIAYLTMFKATEVPETTFEQLITIIMAFRAFNRLFHEPLVASIDSAVSIFLISADSFTYLTMTSFCINRALIFVRKLTYIIVSYWTAIKNKK